MSRFRTASQLVSSGLAAAVVTTAPPLAQIISTCAGASTADGIPATAAQLGPPAGISVDHAGNLLIADASPLVNSH